MERLLVSLCLTSATLIGLSTSSANADLTTPVPCTTYLSNVQTSGGDINVTAACNVIYQIDHIDIPNDRALILSREALSDLQRRNDGRLSAEALSLEQTESRRLNNQGIADTARTTIVTLATIAASPENPIMDSDKRLEAAAAASAWGQFDEAQKLFELIRAPALNDPALRNKVSAEACFGLAVLAELKLNYSDAEIHLNEAMSWQPKDPKYRAYLSQFLAFAGRPSEAIVLAVQAEDLTEVDTGGGHVQIYRWIGDAFQDSLSFTRALSSYDKAQREWDRKPGLKSEYAQLLLSAAGLNARLRNLKSAEDLYSKARLSGAVSELTKYEKLAFWNNMGVFYLNAGCSEPAKEYADFVLRHEGSELQPNDPLLAFSLGVRGRALYIESSLPDAVQTLQNAIDAVGRSFNARHWRAAQFRTYKAEVLLATKDFGAARTLLEEAVGILALKPEEGHLQFAITLAALSRVQLSQSDPLASNTLGRAERYLNSIPQITQAEPLWRIRLGRAEQAAQKGDAVTSKQQLLEALDADQSYALRLILRSGYHDSQLETVLREADHDLSFQAKLAQPSLINCSSAPVPSLL